MNIVAQTLLGVGRTTPMKAAVVTTDGRTLTYGDLDRLSAQLANLLKDTYGISKGDRVAVQLDKSPELFALNVACARIGAIYVPLNTSYTDREVNDLLDDAGPALLVRRVPIEHATSRTDLSRLLLEARDHSTDFDDVPCGIDTPAAMLYTSGTTGRAKGAVLTHGNLAFNCQTLNSVWSITSDDVLLHVLPLFHTHGLFVAAYCTLSSGASMLLMETFEVAEVVRRLSSASVFMGVPTQYVRLLSDPGLNKEAALSIRLFVSGSAPMLRSTHTEFAQRTGHEIIERYGMTETGMITSNPIDGSLKIGTVGPALPGVTIRIDGVPPGVVEVKGPNVLIDYWNRPELRETEFTADGWFKTGDVGVMDADGFLEIVGRAKDLIISGGFNVYPKELELVIDEFPDVLESAVIGLPDADFGEAVTAVVVARPGARLDEGALSALARSSLAGFKVPKRFIFVAELPRNAMGKVQKAQLRRQFTVENP